jgi:hypothetical protein
MRHQPLFSRGTEEYVYYWGTYEKAVSGGGDGKGGHVLKSLKHY